MTTYQQQINAYNNMNLANRTAERQVEANTVGPVQNIISTAVMVSDTQHRGNQSKRRLLDNMQHTHILVSLHRSTHCVSSAVLQTMTHTTKIVPRSIQHQRLHKLIKNTITLYKFVMHNSLATAVNMH